MRLRSLPLRFAQLFALSWGSILIASSCLGQEAIPASQPDDSRPRSIKSLKINSTTAIKVDRASDAGAYIIDTDDTTFDFHGSTITAASDTKPADQFVGRAIIIRKAKNVTLKNVNIHGLKVAIYAEDAPGLRLENCDVSRNYRMHLKSTPQREHRDDWLWPHKNDDNEWLHYGAGIYLLRCDDAKIVNCKARNGQNGICLSRSDRVEISGNDMSFMSGWGLALYRSNKCRVLGNRFDYCVRGYSHGVYHRGQDSAGILVFEQSSDNLFAYNSATHGGDGFFLYGGDETLKVTGKGGCNRNVIYKNDFSHAVMHGIEATFSEQNVIVGNILNHSENGVWGGYSKRTLIGDNTIAHCTTGVAIEHGQFNRVVNNDIRDTRTGIHLWWDEDKPLMAFEYCKKNDTASSNESAEFNLFQRCNLAISMNQSVNAKCVGNVMKDCETVVRFQGDAAVAKVDFSQNNAAAGRIENKSPDAIRAVFNTFPKDLKVEGRFEFIPPLGQPARIEDAESILGGAIARLLVAPPRDWALVSESGFIARGGQPPRKVSPPAVGANRPPADKANLFIDEWGPYDFVEPRLYPSHFVGSPPVAINVLGPLNATYKVLHGIDPHFEVSPMTGDAPGLLAITPRTGDDAPLPGVYPLELDVKIGKAVQRLSCTIIIAPWNVRYYKWDSSLDPLKGDDNWRKIIAAAPIKTEKRDNLELPFGGNGPTPDVKEQFALVAETRLSLLDEKWQVRTISDDGVRVYFNGKRVIDNWTWHVPTEDTAVVEVNTDSNCAIRVEYFEITGHAQLQFFLEPAN